jgi:hypothetical protein
LSRSRPRAAGPTVQCPRAQLWVIAVDEATDNNTDGHAHKLSADRRLIQVGQAGEHSDRNRGSGPRPPPAPPRAGSCVYRRIYRKRYRGSTLGLERGADRECREQELLCPLDLGIAPHQGRIPYLKLSPEKRDRRAPAWWTRGCRRRLASHHGATACQARGRRPLPSRPQIRGVDCLAGLPGIQVDSSVSLLDARW